MEGPQTSGAAPEAGFISAFKRPTIRTLAISRASNKLAQAVVSYGVMVYLATQGGTQLQISIVAASTYLSAVLFGLQGGLLADSLSKRIAIVGGYVSVALLCILMPIVFGTSVPQLLIITFVSSAVMQVVSPSLKAMVAVVATPAELATVSASVSVVGSIASAFGSSAVAPLLISQTSINTLLIIAGLIYLVGAWRTLKLPKAEEGVRFREAIGQVDWRPRALSARNTAEWLRGHRSIGAMILVGVIAVSIYEAFSTLIPVYVRDVLNADPTNAIYIFAPAGIGFLIGTFLTPTLIRKLGTRKLAVTAVTMMSASMILFGLVDAVAPVLAPISPLRLLGWLFSVEINDQVLAASVIAVPANFGSTAAGAAVQTYINAVVPLERQGATFGAQEVQENLFTLMLVLLLGLISTVVGPRVVFISTPIVIVALVLWLIRYSHRLGDTEITPREAFRELVSDDEPDPIRDR